MSKGPLRILHLGLGRFHRAHQATYYQDLFEQHHNHWGVIAFSMRSPQARDELKEVNLRYPVIEFSKENEKLTWVDMIQAAGFIVEDNELFLNYFANPDIQLVTLTVSEKAYSTQELTQHLIDGLQYRKNKINSGLAILSCDNLRSNGDVLKKAVLDLANSDLKIWIESHVTFPNSMVDRIVPALKQEQVSDLQKNYNINNNEILATESFRQWVIEDNFKSERPPLEKVGVQFVADVKPFEEMKLRLLNASHSLIAYSGLLKGYDFVHQAINDPEIKADVLALYKEVIPFIDCPNGFDVQIYTQSLIERFDNKRLPHQLRQIAMDGSQKLPQRILPSLLEAIKNNSERKTLKKVILNWSSYCYLFEPEDPWKNIISEIKSQCENQKEFQHALLKQLFNNNFLNTAYHDFV